MATSDPSVISMMGPRIGLDDAANVVHCSLRGSARARRGSP